MKTSNDSTNELPESSVDSEDELASTSCGIWGFTPNWLQVLASKKMYVLVYGVLGANHSAIGSYFSGTISTIEKRFRMPSISIGIIASAWDIGQLSGSIIIAYLGKSGYKTRWVAAGALFGAVSCLLRFLPQIIFGPGTNLLSQEVNVTSNLTDTELCNIKTETEEYCTLESDGFMTFMILFIAHIFVGIGTSGYDTLGLAYMDDNSLKDKVPFLYSLSVCIRFLGPSMGLLFASYALQIYIDPSIKPSFSNDDPRWIGAWWLGWIPLGMINVILAFIMALFPKILPREALRRKVSNIKPQEVKISWQDFLSTMKRLVKNRILMYNSFSSTFYILGMIGFWVFMPKYIETQFRVSSSEANFITGSIGLTCNALGIVSSGAIISKFKPSPTALAAWNVFTETIDVIGHIIFAFIGCPKDDLHGKYNDAGRWDLIFDCNAGCNCSDSIKYTPVCSIDGTTTFYSPCHAGCSSVTIMENSTKVYEDCSCIPNYYKAAEGACSVDCGNQFIFFVILLCTMRFLSSSGRAGNTVIQFRSVAPEDKAISIGMTETLLCTLAFIPGPIFYGMLLDYSCLVWGKTCGVTGNCWLYDGKVLRYLLNFIAAGFLTIAVLLDVGVLVLAKSLKIYDKDIDQKNAHTDLKTSFNDVQK